MILETWQFIDMISSWILKIVLEYPHHPCVHKWLSMHGYNILLTSQILFQFCLWFFDLSVQFRSTNLIPVATIDPLVMDLTSRRDVANVADVFSLADLWVGDSWNVELQFDHVWSMSVKATRKHVPCSWGGDIQLVKIWRNNCSLWAKSSVSSLLVHKGAQVFCSHFDRCGYKYHKMVSTSIHSVSIYHIIRRFDRSVVLSWRSRSTSIMTQIVS